MGSWSLLSFSLGVTEISLKPVYTLGAWSPGVIGHRHVASVLVIPLQHARAQPSSLLCHLKWELGNLLAILSIAVVQEVDKIAETCSILYNPI